MKMSRITEKIKAARDGNRHARGCGNTAPLRDAAEVYTIETPFWNRLSATSWLGLADRAV